MKERLEKLIGVLNEQRDSALADYVSALEAYDRAASEVTMGIITKAQILHDLDRHITNLEMELKRIDAIEKFGTACGLRGVANA